ncbi:hypothetical protein [Lysobacter sp. HA35]
MKNQHARRRVTAALVAAGLALAGSNAVASGWIDELEQSCNAGDGGDCGTLGSQLMLGAVVPKDAVRARAAFEKGCGLDDRMACVGLYQALALGEGGPQEQARAKQLEPKVCKTGIVSVDVHLKAKGLCRD